MTAGLVHYVNTRYRTDYYVVMALPWAKYMKALQKLDKLISCQYAFSHKFEKAYVCYRLDSICMQYTSSKTWPDQHLALQSCTPCVSHVRWPHLGKDLLTGPAWSPKLHNRKIAKLVSRVSKSGRHTDARMCKIFHNLRKILAF